jgi:hypothetical protein
MGFSFGNLLSAFRSPNTMGSESGGRKRFTSGTMPQFEQRDVVAQPFEQPEPYEPPEIQSRAYGPEARKPFQSPMSLPGGLAEDRRSEGMKYYDELENIRTNRGPALSAYQKALEEQPTYDQFKPSFGRKLAAGIAGGAAGLGGDARGGVQMAQYIKDAPYDRAKGEYESRMKNLGASAKLEQDEIEAKLKSLQAARALGLDYDEYELKKTEHAWKRITDENAMNVANRGAATGEKNAETNQTQAETGQFNADTQRWEAGATDRWRNRTATTAEEAQDANERNINSMIEDRLRDDETARARIAASLEAARIRSGATNPSPASNQQGAIDNAVRMMARDPRFSRYFDMEDPAAPSIKADDKSPGYEEMMRELQTITERQLFKGTPFGEPPVRRAIPIEPGTWEKP